MKKIVFFLILIPFLSLAQKEEVLHFAYGKAPQQILDLYLPKGNLKNSPVVIMLHGGAWSIGGLEYTSKHADDLRKSGFIVANVDYRYVSNKISAKELLKDIDDAVNYVSEISKKYGYAKSGYHIAGISAGAHLALLYGYSHPNIKSIVALCAPSRLDSPEVFEFIRKKEHLEIIELLAGAKFNANGSNPAFEAVSPFFTITNVPTLLIHGDADNVVGVHLSENLFAELQRKGIESKLEIRNGKGHDVGMNSPETERQNIADISNWIKNHQK